MAALAAFYWKTVLVAAVWTFGGSLTQDRETRHHHHYYGNRVIDPVDHPAYAEAAVESSSESDENIFQAPNGKTNTTNSSSATEISHMELVNNNDSNNVLTGTVDQSTVPTSRNGMGSEHWCWMLRYLGVALWNASRNTCECVCVNCKNEIDFCGYHTIQDIASSFRVKQKRRLSLLKRKYYPRHGCQNGGKYRLSEEYLTRNITETVSTVCMCGNHAQGRCCEQLVCQNGGKVDNLGYRCLCPGTYAGRFCQYLRGRYRKNIGEIDDTNNPCENYISRKWYVDCRKWLCGEHGHIAAEDGTCKCDSGYTGEKCVEKQIITHCMNDGWLLPKTGSPQNIACICSVGYRGRRCEIPICQNGGRPKNESHCFCPHRRFHGKRCQSHKCENGGISLAYSDPATYKYRYDGFCKCSKFFKGTFCTELTGLGGVLYIGLPIGILMIAVTTALCLINRRTDSVLAAK